MYSIYIINILNLFLEKYINIYLLKYNIIVIWLNMLFYYNFFIDLKILMILKFMSLMDFTSLHYPDNLSEMELNYYILSYNFVNRILIKLLSKKEDLIISLSNIFWSSAWLEREVLDMFGIKFIFHSDLRRILTDYGFLGHPLLKYFPLSGFYELRFDELFNKVIKELLELAQMFRLFNHINPWVRWDSKI